MIKGDVIGRTRSICPVCGRQLPAKRVRRGDEVFLHRECPVHGEFSVVIWRGDVDFLKWRGDIPELSDGENLKCPGGCMCSEHLQDTCCVLYEVTKRCSLNCPFCFADAGGADKPIEEIRKDISDLTKRGETLLQISGGEPTVRDDLPEIISFARSAGCKYIQLNTNGLRLIDESYTGKLAEAGLSFVFMQFDGSDEANVALRGMALRERKVDAVRVCGKYNLGVTLVPTLVPGVNTNEIGDIIKFAVSMSPSVRGVHFQPVSYFGRIPSGDVRRYTLGELISAVRKAGISQKNIVPSSCDHPLCGFHASFIAEEDGRLSPLSKRGLAQDCCASKNREYVGSRWQRKPLQKLKKQCCAGSLDEFLERASRSFTLTAMAFQDAYTFDIERLRHCSLHVYSEGKLSPFCSHYLSLFER